MSTPFTATHDVATMLADTATVRLGPGIGLPDLAVTASDCGQFLMITCGEAILAVIGAMGSDVAAIEFADGCRYPPAELLDLIGG